MPFAKAFSAMLVLTDSVAGVSQALVFMTPRSNFPQNVRNTHFRDMFFILLADVTFVSSHKVKKLSYSLLTGPLAISRSS